VIACVTFTLSKKPKFFTFGSQTPKRGFRIFKNTKCFRQGNRVSRRMAVLSWFQAIERLAFQMRKIIKKGATRHNAQRRQVLYFSFIAFN
jgi:hypothetical protein